MFITEVIQGEGVPTTKIPSNRYCRIWSQTGATGVFCLPTLFFTQHYFYHLLLCTGKNITLPNIKHRFLYYLNICATLHGLLSPPVRTERALAWRAHGCGGGVCPRGFYYGGVATRHTSPQGTRCSVLDRAVEKHATKQGVQIYI